MMHGRGGLAESPYADDHDSADSPSWPGPVRGGGAAAALPAVVVTPPPSSAKVERTVTGAAPPEAHVPLPVGLRWQAAGASLGTAALPATVDREGSADAADTASAAGCFVAGLQLPLDVAAGDVVGTDDSAAAVRPVAGLELPMDAASGAFEVTFGRQPPKPRAQDGIDSGEESSAALRLVAGLELPLDAASDGVGDAADLLAALSPATRLDTPDSPVGDQLDRWSAMAADFDFDSLPTDPVSAAIGADSPLGEQADRWSAMAADFDFDLLGVPSSPVSVTADCGGHAFADAAACDLLAAAQSEALVGTTVVPEASAATANDLRAAAWPEAAQPCLEAAQLSPPSKVATSGVAAAEPLREAAGEVDLALQPPDSDEEGVSKLPVRPLDLDSSAASVVRINAQCLPPPFTLEVISSVALSPDALFHLDPCRRSLEVTCVEGELRVGLDVQPDGFWGQVLPDAVARGRLAPLHFEVSLAGAALRLRHLGGPAAATALNGRPVLEEVDAVHGDVIGIGAPDADQQSLLIFRVHALAHLQVDRSDDRRVLDLVEFLPREEPRSAPPGLDEAEGKRDSGRLQMVRRSAREVQMPELEDVIVIASGTLLPSMSCGAQVVAAAAAAALPGFASSQAGSDASSGCLMS